MIANVRDLLDKRLGVPVWTRGNSPSVPNVGTTAAVLIKQDAARIGFIAVNLGSNPCFLVPDGIGSSPAAGIGLKLEPQGGNVALLWEEDGEMVAWAWQAAVLVGSTLVLVLEILIDQGRQADETAAA